MIITQSVPEAAKLLDKVNPGWYEKIDIHTLDMEDCHHCILGQLYGDYNYGWKALFTTAWYIEFNGSDFGYEVDRQKWIDEINLRIGL